MTALALRMADTIRHRGPDHGGAWADADAGIALSMRRLAIIDLSPAGHQPMHSGSDRFVMVFNGEIYNCEDVRREILAARPGLMFRGHSDTEVMLAAFELWGIRSAVQRFNGMFAFALWDRQTRELTLARDRFGEKPLYYSIEGGRLIFGSELRALRVHPAFGGEIDSGAVALFLRHNCIPAPHSIYENTRKLMPGTLLTVSAEHLDVEPVAYWSLRDVMVEAAGKGFKGTDAEAVQALDELMRDAVKIRMHSDVPLGAFLSGGIDSSTIVALMQAQSARPIQTFSIGMNEEGYDEASDAAKVAAHLKTDHTGLYVTAKDATAVLPQLAHIYDEPFADSSQIPTYLVSALARKHVTVSLSGDGGDEIFGGYNRHVWGAALWNKMGRFPVPLRRLAAGCITVMSPDAWDAVFARFKPVLPGSMNHRHYGYKLHKLASVMSSEDPYEMYYRLVSHWFNPGTIMPGAVEPVTQLTNSDRIELTSATEEMMYLDSVTYLPDDILVKLDRASMAVSLEGRVPFLDHRVAAFAASLPLSMRVRDGQGKWLLRQLLFRYVPRELVERPKSGFGIPLDSWLRGPLREWAEELLSETRLRSEGFFDPRPIRAAWDEHLSGRRNQAYQLWDVLMFQSWLEEHHRPVSDLAFAS